MSATVFLAVICAAILHASWNALVKGGTDKLVSMGALVLGHIPLGVLSLLYAPMPDPASLPYLGAGILLHVGYQLFLLQSYKIGDLTQVYPMARGSAPLMVALVSVAFLGVTLSTMEFVAILIIGSGIVSLSFVRRAAGMRNHKAAAFALGTGMFIAAYSIIDGLGARVAGTALGFYGWLTLGNSLVMLIYLRFVTLGTLSRIATNGRKVFLIGGSASYVAYALVTWSFTQAPIALVTALRETSIIIALLIGVFFLKVRLDLAKVIATMLTLIGAIILRFVKC